ncbi:hypothetical protein CU043_12675 [Corynebacterium striatum]|nr:hypothetical protein [Corynebacterium striatum]
MQASINDPVQLGISADVALFEVADRGVLIADPEAFFGGTAQIDLDFWLIGARFFHKVHQEVRVYFLNGNVIDIAKTMVGDHVVGRLHQYSPSYRGYRLSQKVGVQ